MLMTLTVAQLRLKTEKTRCYVGQSRRKPTLEQALTKVLPMPTCLDGSSLDPNFQRFC